MIRKAAIYACSDPKFWSNPKSAWSTEPISCSNGPGMAQIKRVILEQLFVFGMKSSVCCIKQNLTANKQLRLPEAYEIPYQARSATILFRDKRNRVAVDASNVIVFKSIRFRVSTLIRYACVFICIHFQQRFQIDAFSVNTLSVFERISVDGRPKRIEMYAFSIENALVWTGSQLSPVNS